MEYNKGYIFALNREDVINTDILQVQVCRLRLHLLFRLAWLGPARRLGHDDAVDAQHGDGRLRRQLKRLLVKCVT